LGGCALRRGGGRAVRAVGCGAWRVVRGARRASVPAGSGAGVAEVGEDGEEVAQADRAVRGAGRVDIAVGGAVGSVVAEVREDGEEVVEADGLIVVGVGGAGLGGWVELVEEHAHIVGVLVRGGEIDVAVAVEVRRRHAEGTRPRGVGGVGLGEDCGRVALGVGGCGEGECGEGGGDGGVVLAGGHGGFLLSCAVMCWGFDACRVFGGARI